MRLNIKHKIVGNSECKSHLGLGSLGLLVSGITSAKEEKLQKYYDAVE